MATTRRPIVLDDIDLGDHVTITFSGGSTIGGVYDGVRKMSQKMRAIRVIEHGVLYERLLTLPTRGAPMSNITKIRILRKGAQRV